MSAGYSRNRRYRHRTGRGEHASFAIDAKGGMPTVTSRQCARRNSKKQPFSIGEAREIIEEWRIDYNTERPHSSLKYQTPEEFAAARPFDKTQWAQPLELLDGSAPAPIAHAAE